ncbi:hypothetical protein HPB50_017718 [Hyalomma asiaticum]|uniref:Uncharacterized protein n=1 Tax=Hyalomma asiaticum TaxID=266040 RepID=A0ACB7SPB0_HYAAI|nr:hypothetical protein HPB50_017718 [Hyalomma asiaticum]
MWTRLPGLPTTASVDKDRFAGRRNGEDSEEITSVEATWQHLQSSRKHSPRNRGPGSNGSKSTATTRATTGQHDDQTKQEQEEFREPLAAKAPECLSEKLETSETLEEGVPSLIKPDTGGEGTVSTSRGLLTIRASQNEEEELVAAVGIEEGAPNPISSDTRSEGTSRTETEHAEMENGGADTPGGSGAVRRDAAALMEEQRNDPTLARAWKDAKEGKGVDKDRFAGRRNGEDSEEITSVEATWQHLQSSRKHSPRNRGPGSNGSKSTATTRATTGQHDDQTKQEQEEFREPLAAKAPECLSEKLETSETLEEGVPSLIKPDTGGEGTVSTSRGLLTIRASQNEEEELVAAVGIEEGAPNPISSDTRSEGTSRTETEHAEMENGGADTPGGSGAVRRDAAALMEEQRNDPTLARAWKDAKEGKGDSILASINIETALLPNKKHQIGCLILRSFYTPTHGKAQVLEYGTHHQSVCNGVRFYGSF